MRAFIEGLLQQQRAEKFAAFQGTDIRGQFPLRDYLVNAALQEKIRKGDSPLKQGAITFLEGGRIAIEVTVGAWILAKTFRLTLQLPPTVDVARDPVIRIGTSGSASLLLPLANAFGRIPEGVTIAGGQITADLRILLERRGYGDLLRYLRRLTFSGERGILLTGFEIQVD